MVKAVPTFLTLPWLSCTLGHTVSGQSREVAEGLPVFVAWLALLGVI